MTALGHVCEALECLHASQTKEQEHGGSQRSKNPSSVNQSRSQNEEQPKMARPFHPIPMPYSPLNASTEDKGKALVVSGESAHYNELTVSVLSHQYCVASWWDKLHVLLLRKASLVYLVMARSNFNAKRYVSVSIWQYLISIPTPGGISS